MTRYPDPREPGDLGPNGAPRQSPRTPHWPTAIVVIIALAVVALALLAHAH